MHLLREMGFEKSQLRKNRLVHNGNERDDITINIDEKSDNFGKIYFQCNYGRKQKFGLIYDLIVQGLVEKVGE